MTALSINLNKVALIRNSREGSYPDVVEQAKVCIDNGADGITVHPRPDQRHIRPDDVRRLAELVKPLESVEFNVEGNPFAPAQGSYPGFIQLVEETLPDQCSLVPDSDDQLTSDHGFDLHSSGQALKPIIDQLHDLGMRVSLFMDPEPKDMALAAAIGADRVELYTESYAVAFAKGDYTEVLDRFSASALAAHQAGMGVNAGHDLNLVNLPQFTIPHLLEVSIGHALTVDALRFGFTESVKRYVEALVARASG